MYLIKTYLDKSAIHGLGTYAGEAVGEGTVLWREVPGFDVLLDMDQVQSLPPAALDFLETYSYFRDGFFHLNADTGKFTNHSDDPNTRINADGAFYACRAIGKGVEITADYNEFSEPWPDGFGASKG